MTSIKDFAGHPGQSGRRSPPVGLITRGGEVTNADAEAAASDEGLPLNAQPAPISPASGGAAPNAEADATTSGYGLAKPGRPAAVSRSRPDHAIFFHWLPWALPLGAIGLPEIILVILGTGIAKHMTADLAAESVDRGDLLIPVIIICAEAFRRWWDTEFNNIGVAACAGFFAMISGLFSLIAIAAYAVVLANPQTRGFADIADTFTWAPLACGLIAGTIAIGQTAPWKTGKS